MTHSFKRTRLRLQASPLSDMFDPAVTPDQFYRYGVPLWTSEGGSRVLVTDMANKHLRRSITWCRRKIESLKAASCVVSSSDVERLRRQIVALEFKLLIVRKEAYRRHRVEEAKEEIDPLEIVFREEGNWFLLNEERHR